MSRTLVIVESPAKAKTIGKYLGAGYVVRASMGHVRDLPKMGLGVEVENGTFEPQYELVRGKGKTISEIKTLAKDASRVLLATDPDREGEAIAWHILTAAGLSRSQGKVSRVEFHEITERAIRAAVAKPRQLDMNLVNAQQARRVLDRLVGYKLSPLLWKKIQKGTSAGRVQSVALRIVVEREREIENFVPREFWTVEADLARSPFSGREKDVFRAILWDVEKKAKRELDNVTQANAIVTKLNGASWRVKNVTKKDAQRRPSAPFITSTLQQEAARKLRMQTQQTMRVAQQLYEGVQLGTEGTTGLITYMRTDSTSVAYDAQLAARDVIKEQYGAEYLPEKPPFYAKKVKGAQEAHEAIRPTKPARTPDSIKAWLTPEQYRLYRLVWQRFIASQMAPARLELTTVDVDASPIDGSPPLPFRASGERILFPGFLVVYREGRGDSEDDEEDEGSLPPLEPGNPLDLLKLEALQHYTEPPPRYGEASLVKALEELGIGRPSTYATILTTLRDRGYVVETKFGKERKFQPTELGRVVVDLLVAQFPDLLDVRFTARLEDELDDIAEGKRQWTPVVAGVYHPMMERVKIAEKEVAKIAVPIETLPPPEKKTYNGRSYGRGSSGSGGRTYSKGYSKGSSSGAGTGTTAKTTRSYSKKTETATESAPAKRPYTRRTTTAPVEETTPVKTTRARRTTTAPPSAPVAVSATDAPSCPLCQKPMARRKGPYSEFWGCTGFPNCRGTRK
jgi:DNA topoisomerase I